MRKGKKALMMLGCSWLTAALMIVWPVREALMVETAVIQRGELVQTALLNGVTCYRQQQPLISLKSGRVARVYAEQGDEINKGDLLFKLDTSVEEQALSALYANRFSQQTALAQLDGAVSAFTLQNELEWQNLESQLLASIEASQIRAAADGVMEEIYVQEGDYVAEAAVLGLAHGAGMQIMVSVSASEGTRIRSGAAAVASSAARSVPVYLTQETSADETGMQTLCFEPIDENGLDSFSAGETVRLEVTETVYPSSALIPLSAIDADGRIWTVQNGKAYAHSIAYGACSRNYISADLAWADETIILHPEIHDLRDGIAVQVRK